MLLESSVLSALRTLHSAFGAQDHEIRLVGGCVRDLLMRKVPKDIDLATTADPDEQVEVYKACGITHHPTGLQHGTWTAVVNGIPFEITSLRTETDHDGRHATVAWTKDWAKDLGRRDLTINAMAMDVLDPHPDAPVIDLFGGREDLEAGRVRFVGSADARMQEDYLRILRWLRFHGRISPDLPLDIETADAARRNAHGLGADKEGRGGISRERVWSEVKGMLATLGGPYMLRDMMRLGLAYPCGMPHGSWREVRRLHERTRNPMTLMVAFLIDLKLVSALADRWKWSGDEKKLAVFLAENMVDEEIDLERLIAKDGFSVAWVRELALLQDRIVEERSLASWNVPVFPVAGRDLIANGMKPGPMIGQVLDCLKEQWAESRFTMTKDELLAKVSS